MMLSIRWSPPENEWACSPLSGGCFFLYACVIPFSCQGPLGVSANLSFLFFFFKFNLKFLFIYLFVPYKPTCYPLKNLQYLLPNFSLQWRWCLHTWSSINLICSDELIELLFISRVDSCVKHSLSGHMTSTTTKQYSHPLLGQHKHSTSNDEWQWM